MTCASLDRCRRERHPRGQCPRCRFLDCARTLSPLCIACGHADRGRGFVRGADRERWGVVELELHPHLRGVPKEKSPAARQRPGADRNGE